LKSAELLLRHAEQVLLRLCTGPRAASVPSSPAQHGKTSAAGHRWWRSKLVWQRERHGRLWQLALEHGAPRGTGAVGPR
jgi:hypothetical protein